VSPRLAECELTHLARAPIDVGLAIRQHGLYEDALRSAGFEVRRLAPLADAPDGVFVEDTAIILGERAVITRPGAASRAGETTSTAEGLAGSLEIHALTQGRVDGGDVLVVERTLYVGASLRTDTAGIEALRAAVQPWGYATKAVALRDCLHLKTCATYAGPDDRGDPLLLVDPRHVDPGEFADVDIFAIAPPDTMAANAVRVGETLLLAAGHQRVRDRLAGRGYTLIELDTSEFRKAEAALSCLSLIAPAI
jgi:dimethylargininase